MRHRIISLLLSILGMFFYTPYFLNPVCASSLLDLSNGDNFNIRFEGQSANNFLGTAYTQYADLNNNGKPDIIIGAPYVANNGSISGSLYVIFDNHLSNLTGTGNTIDLSDSNNWDIRYDGDASDQLSLGRANVTDLNNDGLNDLIIPVPYDDNNSLGNSGSAYFVMNSQIANHVGTGNIVQLSQSSSYNLRIDGAQASTYFSYDVVNVVDLDGNGSRDLLINQNHANYNSRTKSGSVYYIKNEIFAPLLTGLGNTLNLASSTSFNARFDGSLTMGYLGYDSISVGDINENGKLDLLLGQPDYVNGTTAGYIYVFDDNLLDTITGTGNLVDLDISANYSLRIAGENLGDSFGMTNKLIDLDNDQLLDLVVGANTTDNNSLTTSGSAFIIKNFVLRDYSGTGNQISMSDTEKYFLRIDGSLANGYLILPEYYSDTAYTVDFDNDGRNDMLLTEGSTPNTIYLIKNSKINNFAGSGNTMSISSSENYDIKYTHNSLNRLDLVDFNADEQADFLFTGLSSAHNSRPNSGSIILVYNFPHVIYIDSANQSGNDLQIRGNILAPNSVTTIADVQYRIGDNNPTADWTGCRSEDGQFDEKTESFSCTPPNFNQIVNENIYIRAVDSNGVYTAQTNYNVYKHNQNNHQSYTLPQIPFMSNYNASSRAVSANMLGNSWPNKLAPVSYIPSKTFSFDAFLSAETIIHPYQESLPNPLTGNIDTKLKSGTVIAGNNKLSFVKNNNRYWQIGPIYNIWYKAYDDRNSFNQAPKIIRSLQKFSSILSLYYDMSLVREFTQSGAQVNLNKLQIAYSADGVQWDILTNSVSDVDNLSVATIGTIGGYYTIVTKVSTTP